MSQYVTVTSDKKKWVAFFLCLIFGLVGFHYFYVGRIGRGLLAMFTLDLFVIGWIIDIIAILSGRFTDNVGNPLRE
jgi:TM2 domain-containing membrane protein YozV